MAHILCITSGLRGFLNASFELVARLQAAGHRVTYASPHEVGDAVRAQGIAYTQLAPVNFDPATPPSRQSGPLAGIRSRLLEWASASRRRQAGVEALQMAGFGAFLSEHKPDLVLLDAELYEHCFTAYASGVRLALLTPFFSTYQHAGMPPLQLGITPDEGWRGSQSGLNLAWAQLRLRRWLEIRKTSLRYAFTERRAVLLAYARKIAFPTRCLEQYGWITLFNFHELPILSLTAQELEFPFQPYPWQHYIGPMVATGRAETEIDADVQQRLETIYAEKAVSGRPLLYCGLTTMDQQDQGFLHRLVDAVSLHPEWLLVVGHSGGAADAIGTLPRHIHAFDYVPQIEVLQQADLCITQGGVNTLNECLLMAVPLLIYATDFADKPGCAARAIYHGLALNGDIEKDDTTMIAANIASTLADPGIPARLVAMRRRILRYRDEKTAETLIDSLLSSPATKP